LEYMRGELNGMGDMKGIINCGFACAYIISMSEACLWKLRWSLCVIDEIEVVQLLSPDSIITKRRSSISLPSAMASLVVHSKFPYIHDTSPQHRSRVYHIDTLA